MPERTLVLDTCALIWLVTDAPELSPEARAAINNAEIVCVSAISAWEISLKTVRNVLGLPLPPGEWFAKALDHHHLTLADLSVDILIAANALAWHHLDHADRFIIATALGLAARVVTTDRRFQLYDVNVIS